MVYGSLFHNATDDQVASLKQIGQRWKNYEKQGQWVYEQHPFWCTGYTFWSINNEAPDLFLHLSDSDLVIFKGDLNHRKLVSRSGLFAIYTGSILLPDSFADLRLSNTF